LCCVLDLFNHEIIGWLIKERMVHDIVLDTLQMAKFQCWPICKVIFYSNQEGQYASRPIRNWLVAEKMQQSMSGSGNCHDDAAMEKFWHSFKVERIQDVSYKTGYLRLNRRIL